MTSQHLSVSVCLLGNQSVKQPPPSLPRSVYSFIYLFLLSDTSKGLFLKTYHCVGQPPTPLPAAALRRQEEKAGDLVTAALALGHCHPAGS